MPPPKLERHVEKTVRLWAEAHGILTTKMNGEGHSGMPDRVFWLPGGRPVIIEFKRPGAKASKLQEYYIGTLARNGYQVGVIDRADVAVEWLERLMKEQWAVAGARFR